MAGKLIGLIYFYLISAVSIGLLIYAAFSFATLVINLTQYDKYPLRYGMENCDVDYPQSYVKGPYATPVMEQGQIASISAKEKQTLKQTCMNQADFDRKQHKLDDIKNSGISALVGLVLFLIHFPQARKMSKI